MIHQEKQIQIIAFDLLKHFVNSIRSLDKQCSECMFLCMVYLFDEFNDELDVFRDHMIKQIGAILPLSPILLDTHESFFSKCIDDILCYFTLPCNDTLWRIGR